MYGDARRRLPHIIRPLFALLRQHSAARGTLLLEIRVPHRRPRRRLPSELHVARQRRRPRRRFHALRLPSFHQQSTLRLGLASRLSFVAPRGVFPKTLVARRPGVRPRIPSRGPVGGVDLTARRLLEVALSRLKITQPLDIRPGDQNSIVPDPDHILIPILMHPSLQGVHLTRLANYPPSGHRSVDRQLRLSLLARLRGLVGDLARDLGINIVSRASGPVEWIGNRISQMSDDSRRRLRAFPACPRPGKSRQGARGSRGVTQRRRAGRQRHFPSPNPPVDRRFPPGGLLRPRRTIVLQSRRPRSVQGLRQSRRSREILLGQATRRALEIRECCSRDVPRLRTRFYARATTQDVLPGDSLQERRGALDRVRFL